MIKNFEYKIPFGSTESFTTVLECVDEVSDWELVISDKKAGVIEWKQKALLGLLVSRIRIYLREPRPKDTLLTIYVHRPFLIVDPLKSCEKAYTILAAKLNEKIQKRNERGL